jgi:integrase
MSIRKRTWKSNGSEKTAWCVDYCDQQGNRRLKTFALKKDAEAWAVKALHEVSHGIHAPNNKTSVEEAINLWIKHGHDNELERGSLEQREQHLRLHIAPFIGREKLATLDTRRVHAFLDQLRAAGRSAIMRRKILTSLATALKFAKEIGLVAQNPAAGITINKADRHTAKGSVKAGRDFPTKAELKLLMDRAPEHWRAFIITAALTGMRASELRGLHWADVDLDAGNVHVRQRADKWGKLGSPKSAAGTRDIPLTPMVNNTLRHWKLACPSGELVFANRCGNIGVHANFLSRIWKPLLRDCGMPRYTFHSLRHVAASLFIETLGWAPKRVQTVLGHASITMTYDLYGHVFPSAESDKEAMKKLDAAISAA